MLLIATTLIGSFIIHSFLEKYNVDENDDDDNSDGGILIPVSIPI